MTPEPRGAGAPGRSRCALCAPGDPPVREVIAAGPHRVVRCEACGLVRLERFPAPDEIAGIVQDEGYGHHGETDFRRTYAAEELRALRAWENAEGVHRQLVRLLARIGLDVARPLRFHDVGCSEGFSLHLAREQGWRPSGNDLSPVRRDFGRRHLGVDFALGYFAGCDLAPASLDVVSMRHVLEHIPDPLAELALVRERLAPGGALVLEVPNFANGALRLKLLRQRLGLRRPALDFLGVPEHLWQFTGRTLARLLEAAGFRVAHVGTSSAHVNHSAATRALLRATVHRLRLGNYLLVAATRA